MVVNIATRCGYTGQLDGLEALYKKYRKQGFELIGIPSNDFGGQTPESSQEVAKVCRLQYGTSFPITKKSVVKGEAKHPLIKYLIERTDKKEIAWNFEKFLISKKGAVLRFPSRVKPQSDQILKSLERFLK